MARRTDQMAAVLLLFLLAGCGRTEPAPSALGPADAPGIATAAHVESALPSPGPGATSLPSETAGAERLSAEEAATLGSLDKVDEYPLYTMRFYGDYAVAGRGRPAVETGPTWSCSLFAALGNPGEVLYGRNFDWDYSPALLLFTDPPGGYASVSMVDIAYLGFAGRSAAAILELPLGERTALLGAPLLPFDGMNEQGLAAGMAAVPPGDMVPDPARPTIGSLAVIRQMLDHAAGVNEAVSILQSYNVDMEGGPPIHYLLADRSGRSVLVEFYQGRVVLLRNEQPWHVATNFLLAAAAGTSVGQCSRYDKIDARLSLAKGRLSRQDAFDLLSAASQVGTQWSVVYGISTSEVSVVMGRQYGQLHTFSLTGNAFRP